MLQEAKRPHGRIHGRIQKNPAKKHEKVCRCRKFSVTLHLDKTAFRVYGLRKSPSPPHPLTGFCEIISIQHGIVFLTASPLPRRPSRTVAANYLERLFFKFKAE